MAPGLQVEAIGPHHPQAVDTLVDLGHIRPIGLESGGVANGGADEGAGKHGVPHAVDLEMKLINYTRRDVMPALVIACRIAVHCEALVPSRQLVQDGDPATPTKLSEMRLWLPSRAAAIHHLQVSKHVSTN